MPPVLSHSALHPLDALRSRTIETLDSLLHPILKRQSDQSNGNTNDIIPTHYPANGRNSGAVIGITLGSVAGFLLLCILIYFLRGGGGSPQGPPIAGATVTGQEDIVVPARRGGGKQARSHRSRSRDRDRDGAPRSHRKSHRRSEREMREISRSPPQRRPSRTIVEERVERLPRGPPSRPSRSQIIVDSPIEDRRRHSRPPSIRRVDGDDIVEVIEEGSIDEPPRRQRPRRSSQGYRY